MHSYEHVTEDFLAEGGRKKNTHPDHHCACVENQPPPPLKALPTLIHPLTHTSTRPLFPFLGLTRSSPRSPSGIRASLAGCRVSLPAWMGWGGHGGEAIRRVSRSTPPGAPTLVREPLPDSGEAASVALKHAGIVEHRPSGASLPVSTTPRFGSQALFFRARDFPAQSERSKDLGRGRCGWTQNAK